MGYVRKDNGEVMYICGENVPLKVKDIETDLLKYLPEYYSTDKYIKDIENTLSTNIQGLKLSVQDLANQLFVQTATWGLAIWESELGIITNTSKPYDERRGLILSKLRGVGVANIELIKNVVEGFKNGAVEITDDVENKKVIIRFIGKYGIPTNIEEVKKAIKDVIPAHLNVEYSYKYLLWENMISDWDYNKTKTWGEIVGSYDVVLCLVVVNDKVYYSITNEGNATLEYDNGVAFAHILD